MHSPPFEISLPKGAAKIGAQGMLQRTQVQPVPRCLVFHCSLSLRLHPTGTSSRFETPPHSEPYSGKKQSPIMSGSIHSFIPAALEGLINSRLISELVCFQVRSIGMDTNWFRRYGSTRNIKSWCPGKRRARLLGSNGLGHRISTASVCMIC